MLKNHLKIALRNIKRHKGYSFINITGLAIGMACCLLITIWVLDELSYDKFHKNAANLYRVEENQDYSGRQFHVNLTPHPLAPALKSEIPEIVDATRYVWAGGLLFRHGDKVFFEDYIRAVDPSFLRMFTFPLLKGDKNVALNSPYSLVLSEDIAEKYFGEEDPLGQIISINNKYDFTVTGIMENIPHNSYVQFDIIIPYEFLRKTGKTDDEFGSNSIQTFVELKENIPVEQVNEKISGFIRTKVPESRTNLVLMPYTRIHLHAYFGWEKNGGAEQYIYIFSLIALFVLLIACINFMNLSTARSASRAKEVGLRKVVGALKRHIIKQFYGESVIFAFIALIFALVIVSLLLPAFSSLAAKKLSWSVTGIESILIGLLAITLFTGFVAGSYPALFLSAFQPVKVLRGSLKSGAGSSRFRKVLVVVQFSISILLIIGTTVVYKQLNFMKNRRLGWDKEHLVYIYLRADIKSSYETLKTELLKDSRILGVTGVYQLPSYNSANAGGADWDGKDPELEALIGINAVDFDFIETLKIEIAEGRSFSKEFSSDLSTSFIVNEEVAKIMEKDSVVGERFSFVGIEGSIVGVMKNFHYQPIRNKIEPLAIHVFPEYINYMLIRIPPGSISESLQFVENTWNRVIPNYPLEYRFLNEAFDRMYRTEDRMGTLLKYFAVLAVFIACLGLFGLASFTAEQRTKEIGVRKVLGASVSQVTLLLCKQFLLLVMLANVIACPVAYLVMKNWLQNYAYQTGMGLFVFVAAMAAALVVAIISVSFQATKAAISNPADSLRYE
ncbi:MAG: FtsX-like permease family protein [Candidatus Aenigmarchaeota archaeon]|nr:FtsX-like permease family protein [Candidatus Aminicenantes bacterium]NIN91631.1 FtsX-like permease family protein [bacterium]NIO19669.1 FtsX-like permease family protein [Candidatus Aenigmarchaeota archaeon]